MPSNKTPSFRKPPVSFTDELKVVFLGHFRENGLLYLSAQMTGVHSSTVTDACKSDPQFGEMYREAKDFHTDSMIKEAVRRAVEGVDEPLIGGKDKDEIVAYKRNYSDRLLELMIKSRREEFRGKDKVDGDEAGRSSGVLVMPSRQPTLDEWEAQYGEAAKGTTGRPEKS